MGTIAHQMNVASYQRFTRLSPGGPNRFATSVALSLLPDERYDTSG